MIDQRAAATMLSAVSRLEQANVRGTAVGIEIAAPASMKMQRRMWAGALLALMFSFGCPGDDIDGPGSDANVADGPQDGPACPAGLKPFYRDPGCGGDAVIFCAASDDGCLGPEICTCEGKTSRLCTWGEKPFRHYGACGTDGGQERPLNWPI
jgi:hypothetical protein